MEQVVKKVVVAGGGSAGWMAAAALSRQLGACSTSPSWNPTPSARSAWASPPSPRRGRSSPCSALDEREFMRARRAPPSSWASYQVRGEVGDRYIHSFGQVGKSTLMAHFHHMWMEARAQGFGGDLGDYRLSCGRRRRGSSTPPTTSMNYAYHIDATRFGRFLRRRCENNGVRRVEGKIQRVEQHPETGFITALVLESGERVEGDLFVDATGFRGLLIEQTLKAGFEDWGQWLPNDRAVAVQTATSEPPLPLTRAIAHRAGWQWGIPLQHREGNGWVYCSEFMSDDEARDPVRPAQGREADRALVPALPPRPAPEGVGQELRRHYSAGGFIEPLEATRCTSP